MTKVLWESILVINNISEYIMNFKTTKISAPDQKQPPLEGI